ncbi:MAG: CPBP family intramembrane metalloprotease [Bacteroidetes bacterium]|nr:CPBP family intramembrane metalloprotease [Bacteroidota bacterium]
MIDKYNQKVGVKVDHKKTILGLVLALGFPAAYSLFISPLIFDEIQSVWLQPVVGLAFMWLLFITLLILVKKWENRTLDSIGFGKIGWKEIWSAIGFGILLMVAVPLLSLLADLILPSGESGSIPSAAQNTFWLLFAGIITAAVTEEALFRGYTLERLNEWTNSKWFSSLISLLFFTIIHFNGWNAAHIIGVVLPLGCALIAIYWWKRSLTFVIVVHFIVNVPMLFL